MSKPLRAAILVGVLAVAAVSTDRPGGTARADALAVELAVRHLQPAERRAAIPDRAASAAAAQAPAAGVAASTPAVGTVRNWLALDEGTSYPKPFALMGAGQHIEVWVAQDLTFPAGDCRNNVDGGTRIVVTPEQIAYLIRQFDEVIYPRMSATFSAPRGRDGTRAEVDRTQYDPAGEADNVVVLVDNVRDENYYDRDNATNKPYVAGFFHARLTELFDRNLITVDAWDWEHRTGGNPPHEPVPGNLCTSAPARPFLYEAVFAHEYAHLLQYYEDRDEVTWVDEGLADYAQSVAGYVDPRRSIYERGHDTHVQCFLGWQGVQTPANPNPRAGGPENSLTRWSDHGGDEVLCDYGAAYTFMEYLAGRFGRGFMSALHRDDASGFRGLTSVLRRFGQRVTVRRLVHDWAAMVALDGVLDRGTPLRGRPRRATYATPRLRATVNWATPRAYARPGAPPNGSDYVRLRGSRGYLHTRNLRSLSFTARDAASDSFTVQLVSYSSHSRTPAHLASVRLGRDGRATLNRSQLRRMVGSRAELVAAIVTLDDPSGSRSEYGRYRLVVNGVVQPGG